MCLAQEIEILATIFASDTFSLPPPYLLSAKISSFIFTRTTSISARVGGSFTKGVSSVVTALLLLLVPLIAPASATLVTSRDALGKGSATSFDLLGRPARTLTGISVPATAPGPQTITAWIAGLSSAGEGETETVYTYDTAPGYGLGKVASVTFKEFERNAGGAITATRQVVETYTYDALGRSVSGSTALSGQVAFNGTHNVSTSYDGLGRVSTVTDAGGYTRASVYNERGFLGAVHEFSAGGPMLWRGMSYDASGKMLLEHNGNGIGTQNRYHPTRGFLESSKTLRWTNK